MISVIIPTYNRAHLIRDTINSVIDQTYKDWELIIVDDGSIDNTFEVVKPFLKDLRIKLVSRPKNRLGGGNAARNYGFELSKGKFIKWLDSDDLLAPNCLEKQVNILTKKNSGVVFCRSQFFFQNVTTGSKELGSNWNDGFILEGDIFVNFIMGRVRFSNNDGLWRQNLLPVKPYSENLKNSQEFHMISMMLSKNIKVELINEILVLIRTHSDQMANKRNYAEYAKNQILARFLVLKNLKDYKKNSILLYLIKSMFYYVFNQIKKGEFRFLFQNVNLIFRSIFTILK